MDDSKPFEGKIIFFTAPSGSGKTTIVRRLLEQNENMSFSISATTRKPRGKEVDGVDYHFLTPKDFLQKVAQTKFAEYEEVYKGLFYGTLKAEIDKIWAMKKHVLIDIDVKGGLRLKKRFPTESLGVFIKLKHLDILETRLHTRNTESPEQIRKRLDRAAYELTFSNQFDKELVNDDLDEAVTEAQKLVDEFVEK
ncbi:MAG: guanylate kinase [Arenicella sp.]|jgi:guanylate kinase